MATVGTTIQEVEQLVIASLKEFVNEPDEVTREAGLEELDVDSLDIVELGQIIEERYEITLDRKKFEGVQTVGDVVDVIAREVAAA